MPLAQTDRTNFDVVIIGGGAAGLSAALWCDELGLSALLLEQEAELGGQLLWTYNEIGNHLGTTARSGRELRDAFLRQVESRGFYLRFDAALQGADLERKQLVLSDGDRIRGRAVVIATGIRRRRLGVEGEDRFYGRGIISSGKAAGRAAAGKRALVVGGGDAALENALILAEYASEVLVVHRRRDFRARAEFIREVESNPKIRLLTETVVKEIKGASRVEAVVLQSVPAGQIRIEPADVVLIRIGVEPNTELFRGQLDLDTGGYIIVDRKCETSVPGVFAAGDVANPVAPTVSSAVGDGATAAKAILSLLNR